MIAGCGTNSTNTTVANVKAAKQLGADAALVDISILQQTESCWAYSPCKSRMRCWTTDCLVPRSW